MIDGLSGIIHVTGEHDTGKTTFALESGAEPSRICFFDDDVKGKSTIESLISEGFEFGRYIDLVDITEGMAELDYYHAVVGEIERIEPGEFDVIIFDTWTKFASTCHSYVVANPREFRTNWSPNGRIKAGEQYKEARGLEARIANDLTGKAKLVVLVTHLKDFYLNNVKVPEKEVPASSKALDRIAVFRVWLRHNPSGSPVPVGLVLKRMSRKVVANGRIRTVNVTPRKIVPHDGDDSLWDAIERYWKNPLGNGEPGPDEAPNEFEMSILDGTLTRDQKNVFESILSSGVVEEDNGYEDYRESVLEMKGNGMNPLEISRETGVPLPKVIELSGGS